MSAVSEHVGHSTENKGTQRDSASARPIVFRLREDLEAVRQDGFRTKRWAVKDPVRFQFYHFDEAEWFLLNSLDGKSTAAEVIQRYRQQQQQLNKD